MTMHPVSRKLGAAALCLVLACAAVCRAAEREDTSDAERQKKEAAVAAARALAQSLFHEIAITFEELRPSEVKEEEQHFGYGSANREAMEMSSAKRRLRLDCILVDPEHGLFVMPDPDLDFNRVAAMTATDAAGKTWTVEFAGVDAHRSAVLLKAKDYRKGFRLPPFAADAVKDGAELLAAGVSRFGRLRDVRVSDFVVHTHFAEVGGIEMFSAVDPPALLYSFGRPTQSARLLFDGEGAPAAIDVSHGLFRKGDQTSYYTDWPRAEDFVSAESLDAMVKAAAEKAARASLTVKFTFRQEGGRSRWSRYDEEESDEWTAYGLPVDSAHLFIPAEQERERIEKIESIKIQFPSGEEVPGRFTGLYKEFEGVLIECSKPVQPLPGLFETRQIPDMALFVDVSVKERLGRKDALAKYNRFFGTTVGYKDKEHRDTLRPVLPGSLVLDASGNLYGFYVKEKKYESATESARGGYYGRSYRYYGYGTGDDSFCFTFPETKERFSQPAAYFDPKVKVKDVQERKELAWLGVEFQPITPELAEELGVESQTRNGKFGLLVNLVYEDSPARKMGIETGDMLLKIQEVGKTGEHLLSAEQSYSSYMYDNYGWDDVGSVGSAVQRGPFGRRNSLTGLLTGLGPGTKAELTYLQAGQTKSRQFIIEKAPPDLVSAEKYKNELTGLTVKDVTYEVRRLLRLGADFQGVIVYEVEPGSAAAVGRITPREFILEVDGVKTGDIAAFQAAMEALVAEGKESATLKVRRLDETRFVEVQLEEPDEEPDAEALIRSILGEQ
jgi:S1-C subfamily serine protease